MFQNQSWQIDTLRVRTLRVRTLRVLMAVGLLAASLLTGATQVSAESEDDPGAVYTMTNATSGNQVMVFARAANGTLTPQGLVSTGGLGTGSSLSSQGSMVLSDNGEWLFLVNGGSDSISAFEVRDNSLHLVDTVPSGGVKPVSLTTHEDLLYVLNAGGNGNISGFRIDDGALNPIAGSTQPLSNGGTGGAPAPAQIQFDASGTMLVVTEKATSLIDTYAVGSDGVAAGPAVHASAGAVPYGFDIDRQNHVVVSEAAGGKSGSGASSYQLGRDGSLTTVSASVGDTQAAACWLVISKNGRFAYTANAASSTLSGYSIGQDGSLALIAPAISTGPSGKQPLDLAISNNGRFLYALAGGGDVIVGYRVGGDGSLTSLGFETPIAATAIGLAAR